MGYDSKHGHEDEGIPILWVAIGVTSILMLLLSVLGLHYYLMDYVLLAISLVILSRMVVVLLLKRRLTVDLLMGVAGLATWYLHAILEGFLIFTLYSISELIEHLAERYAKRKLVGLRELLPSEVSVEVDNNIVKKKLSEVDVGDILLIKPGEVVPVDGVIVEGESVFDTSYVTGEPEPTPLGKGDYVTSGYINKAKLVRVRALRKPSESLLQLLIVEAEKALERKASLQKFIERFSQPYTLLVLGIFGIAALILPPYRALAILLAGCPSAFIIASSTATALSIALLARRSTVVRGGRVLEDLSKVKVMVFDKTGTITLGDMRITRVYAYGGRSREEVLSLAGGAAKASNHPVALTLSKYSSLTPTKAEEYPGKGLKALINGFEVLVGSNTFLKEQGVLLNVSGRICGDGEREVYVAVNKMHVGVVCLEEEVSDRVRKVFKELRRAGLDLAIASGDRVDRVKKIAEYLGVDKYYGELSPDDKRRLVVELKKRYGKTAFVGDGINDVEALAEADVGIAIGSLRVVSNIGDVVLVKGIETIPLLIKQARKYIKSIYASILIALVIKLFAMVLGLMGMIPLWLIVGIGDDGSTLAALGLITLILSKH